MGKRGASGEPLAQQLPARVATAQEADAAASGAAASGAAASDNAASDNAATTQPVAKQPVAQPAAKPAAQPGAQQPLAQQQPEAQISDANKAFFATLMIPDTKSFRPKKPAMEDITAGRGGSVRKCMEKFQKHVVFELVNILIQGRSCQTSAALVCKRLPGSRQHT